MSKVLTFGVYDYFHLGHLRLFKQARKYGDYLVVAVQDYNFIKEFKPDTTILYSTLERVELISSLKIVDEVIVYKYICSDFLEKIDFNVLALGEDQLGKRFEEAEEWCKKHGRKVVRLKRMKGIASSEIKETLQL